MSDLTAAEWNERYPAGTPVRYDGQTWTTVGAAGPAVEACGVPMSWLTLRGCGHSVGPRDAPVGAVEPLTTDAERLAAGWLDPAGVEIVWAARDKAIAERDEVARLDGDAWERLTAERDKAIPERGSLARRLALRFEETEKLKVERDELRALFDLQYTRMTEATELWRQESPAERALMMPDLGDLLAWLIHRADVARASLNERSEVMADEVIYAHALLAAQAPVIDAARAWRFGVFLRNGRNASSIEEPSVVALVVAIDTLDDQPPTAAGTMCRGCGTEIRPRDTGAWLDNDGSMWCPSDGTAHQPRKAING